MRVDFEPHGGGDAFDAEAAEATLAASPHILAEFEKTYAALGAVGEERNAKIIFLALVSRLLQGPNSRPVSIAVKGPSSAGKSYTVETVLKFFPTSEYRVYTTMSEKALAYTDFDFRHRFLVLCEAAGMTSAFTTYLVRSLLSEGRISHETVEKTSGGHLQPRRIEKEGPTGLIVTTTRVALHPENETRLLSLTVMDTEDQTRAILEKLAAEPTVPPDLQQWHTLQRFLGEGKRQVAIPYAKALVRLIPPKAVRLRRDVPAVLNLVRAHAMLHQATRSCDGEGRITATLDDYAAVHELVADIVSEGVGATVSKEIRETVKAVLELGGYTFESAVSLSQIAKHLRVDKSTASRRVKVAVKEAYLQNLEDRAGKPARIILGEPLPEVDEGILPTPEALHRCTH